MLAGSNPESSIQNSRFEQPYSAIADATNKKFQTIREPQILDSSIYWFQLNSDVSH